MKRFKGFAVFYDGDDGIELGWGDSPEAEFFLSEKEAMYRLSEVTQVTDDNRFIVKAVRLVILDD